MEPQRFGNWHTIYTRMNRWAKSGVLDSVSEKLQREQIVRIQIEAVSLDSSIVKVYPDAKAGRELLGGIGPPHPIMDRAYEDNETRQLTLDSGLIPVAPPKCNRLEPWQYDKAIYHKRNEVETSSDDSRASAASSPASTNSMCLPRLRPLCTHRRSP